MVGGGESDGGREATYQFSSKGRRFFHCQSLNYNISRTMIHPVSVSRKLNIIYALLIEIKYKIQSSVCWEC